MKKTKFFIVVALCLFIIGCSYKKDLKEFEEENKETQIEKTIKNMYTDSEKLVYDSKGNFKIVFYYKDNKITGVEHYYEYKDIKESEKKYKEDLEKLKNDSSIKKISRIDKYVIYTIAGKEYEGKTVKDIKETYAYLLPVYEK